MEINNRKKRKANSLPVVEDVDKEEALRGFRDDLELRKRNLDLAKTDGQDRVSIGGSVAKA